MIDFLIKLSFLNMPMLVFGHNPNYCMRVLGMTAILGCIEGPSLVDGPSAILLVCYLDAFKSFFGVQLSRSATLSLSERGFLPDVLMYVTCGLVFVGVVFLL